MKILAIDLGTTGCKVGIFDPERLTLIEEAYREYPLIVISSKEIEQDATLWWDLVKTLIKEVIKNARIEPKEIRALGISSQGISFVPVDRGFNPIYNAISWLDTRAIIETKTIEEKFSFTEIFKKTGKRLNPAYVLPKFIWLKKNRPDIYDKAYKFLMGEDFIIAKLTGIPVTDHSMASGTLLYDIERQDWCMELLETFGIPIEKLPSLSWGGEVIGYIRNDITQELNLESDTLVILGGQDQKCGVFGAGLIKEDSTVSISFGTAIAVSRVIGTPILDPLMRIPCFSYLIPHQYILEGVIGTGGSSLNWLKDIFSIESFNDMMEEGKKSKDKFNKLFFFPHLAGATSPYWKEELPGTFYGITLSTTKSDIIWSVIEGLAFQVKKNIEVIEELSGEVEDLVLFGGGAKGKLIREIFVNVLAKPLFVFPYPDMPLIGVSLLAGIVTGIFRDYKEIIPLIRKKASLIEPEIRKIEIYGELYMEYLEIQSKLL
ncbi:MAG: xylulokinase [bacterium]